MVTSGSTFFDLAFFRRYILTRATDKPLSGKIDSTAVAISHSLIKFAKWTGCFSNLGKVKDAQFPRRATAHREFILHPHGNFFARVWNAFPALSDLLHDGPSFLQLSSHPARRHLEFSEKFGALPRLLCLHQTDFAAFTGIRFFPVHVSKICGCGAAFERNFIRRVISFFRGSCGGQHFSCLRNGCRQLDSCSVHTSRPGEYFRRQIHGDISFWHVTPPGAGCFLSAHPG